MLLPCLPLGSVPDLLRQRQGCKLGVVAAILHAIADRVLTSRQLRRNAASFRDGGEQYNLARQFAGRAQALGFRVTGSLLQRNVSTVTPPQQAEELARLVTTFGSSFSKRRNRWRPVTAGSGQLQTNAVQHICLVSLPIGLSSPKTILTTY